MSETRQRRGPGDIVGSTQGHVARMPMGAAVLAAGLAGLILSGGDIVNYSELLRNFSMLILGCALTAIVEEALFRGLLMNALLYAGKRRMFHVKHRREDDAARDARGQRTEEWARVFHVKHAKERGESCGSCEPRGTAGAVTLAAVIGSALVFAALHVVPAAGEPWPWQVALEAQVEVGSEGALGTGAAQGAGGALGVAVAVVLKVTQALLFGIALAGLRLASLPRTDRPSPPAPGAGTGAAAGTDAGEVAASLLRLDGLAVPIGVHFGFDVLYFAPVVLATGAFPLTYISATPAEWTAVAGSAVVLLWPAARALGIARRGMLPYDDDQDRCRL